MFELTYEWYHIPNKCDEICQKYHNPVEGLMGQNSAIFYSGRAVLDAIAKWNSDNSCWRYVPIDIHYTPFPFSKRT